MSERKPFGITWNSWIDRQIEESRQRGDFDNLPGKGKAFPKSDQPYEDDWWIKSKMKDENFNLTPQTIKVRKKVEEWLSKYYKLSNIELVKFQAEQLNRDIIEANKGDLGPLLPQELLDIDQICKDWEIAQSSDA